MDFVLTNRLILVKDYGYMVSFGLLYTFNNFLQTKLFDREPYVFLTWESYDSLTAVAVIVVAMTLAYFGIAKASEKMMVKLDKKVKDE
mmetsp:Transcript_11125/g.12517  ORF Transcript_11125/g.12517 Transcript_11125/m.12517 type:complete len:88 (+) Transcript_11125:523-786(+)|eukprot:CAMPEP_0168329884 /NCGR_PEP_ID=MMETSP0213-20121227/7378_1 /TAXON_ID=151035 /ORGANISM="Euplotes harpa, Strain FSP1.4" /LENGTH=87 /DNA_ID=CAMNT_0008333303 /DNA_START=626 /DNA_END=889 /DNA_ORIENTATION=+